MRTPSYPAAWVIALASVTAPNLAEAWGLKTHLWIGAQVVQDVTDDGKIKVLGRDYVVPANVASAIKAHPDRYLMGNLGPDVFPDPIVGQTTTHPGVEGGWQTDQWLRHLLATAADAEQTAFSYGFLGHAAGDIFAHTYVNAYAGSIFELENNQSTRVVETRHFILEKYIESKTPAATAPPLRTATSFARDTFILNHAAAKQNGKVKSAAHLRAMYDVREAVNKFDQEFSKIHNRLTQWGADFFKQHAKLSIDLASAKHAVDVAKTAVDIEEKELKAKEVAYDLAKQRLREARDFVKNNPDLITANETLLLRQTQAAVEATADAARIVNELNKEISKIEGRLNDVLSDLGNTVCNALGDVCKKLKNEIDGLRDSITLRRERQALTQKVAEEAARARDQTRDLLSKLKSDLDKAAKGLADGTYDSAVALSEAKLKAERELLEGKKKAVAEAEKIQQKIEKELNKVIPVIDQIKEATDRLNPVTLLVQNWRNDIEIASEEYVKASHQAGLIMLAGAGNPIDPYSFWLSCYGQVFMAQPKEFGQAGCLTKKYIEDLKSEIDKAIDGLPELIRWLVFPSREISKIAEKELKSQLVRVGWQVAAFVTDPQTSEFLQLLTDPGNANRERLNDEYRKDRSKLKLIQFDNVADLIDRDLQLNGGILDPQKFGPLLHSVILAKLTLLDSTELNKLAEDLAGKFVSPLYGTPLYPPTSGNYSLLLDAVRSIDGNHQWQAFGLPWPRRKGVAHGSPQAEPYGHNYYVDRARGFRFFVDPFLRERVFYALFPGPVLGALGSRAELQWPAYSFPECAANRFPATQGADGVVLREDRRCVDATDPNQPPTLRNFVDRSQYKQRFLLCDEYSKNEFNYAAIVSSPKTAQIARKRVAALETQFPDMQFEVRRPVRNSRHWAVLASACTSKAMSEEAREISVSRSIARDAYVVAGR